MYGVMCIYKIEASSISGQPVMPWEELLQREHEWLPWLEEVSVHMPLTLKMIQIGMLALLTSQPFFHEVMIGQSW